MFPGLIEISLTLIILAIISPFFGSYMAKVYMGKETFLDSIVTPVEKAIYTIGGIRQDSMTGWQYIKIP